MITYPIIFFSSQGGVTMYDDFGTYEVGDFSPQNPIHKYLYLYWNPNQPYAKGTDSAFLDLSFLGDIKLRLKGKFKFEDFATENVICVGEYYVGLVQYGIYADKGIIDAVVKKSVYRFLFDHEFLYKNFSKEKAEINKGRYYKKRISDFFQENANENLKLLKSRYYFFGTNLKFSDEAKSLIDFKKSFYLFKFITNLNNNISNEKINPDKLRYYEIDSFIFSKNILNSKINFEKILYYEYLASFAKYKNVSIKNAKLSKTLYYSYLTRNTLFIQSVLKNINLLQSKYLRTSSEHFYKNSLFENIFIEFSKYYPLNTEAAKYKNKFNLKIELDKGKHFFNNETQKNLEFVNQNILKEKGKYYSKNTENTQYKNEIEEKVSFIAEYIPAFLQQRNASDQAYLRARFFGDIDPPLPPQFVIIPFAPLMYDSINHWTYQFRDKTQPPKRPKTIAYFNL